MFLATFFRPKELSNNVSKRSKRIPSSRQSESLRDEEWLLKK